MTTPPHELIPLIIADLYEIAGALRRRGEAIARSERQTQARWQVLSAASDLPKSVAQIARRLGVARQNVQRIADTLVGDGLSRFAANPDHRTSPHLLLTEAGRAVLARLSEAAAISNTALGERICDLRLDEFRADLQALAAALRDFNAQGMEDEDDDAR